MSVNLSTLHQGRHDNVNIKKHSNEINLTVKTSFGVKIIEINNKTSINQVELILII